MPQPVKSSTAQDFPRRRARALATRTRVLAAARTLFVERGYVGTTITAIAECADVSPETIYATFRTKRAVLSELVDVSISGGVSAPPILEQEWVQELRAESDPYRRARLLASRGRAILERRSEVDEIVRGAAAADPEIAILRDRGAAERYAGQRELLRIVVGATGLRDGLDIEVATDVLYAIGSPETYRLLVFDRGWDPERFEQWYGDTIERLILAPPE